MNAHVEVLPADEELTADQTHNPFALEQLNFIEVAVERYIQRALMLDEAMETLKSVDPDSLRIMVLNGANIGPGLDAQRLHHLLKVEAWNSVYLRSNISMFLDSDKRKEWEQKLYAHKENKADLPDFTLENVTETVKTWYAERETMFIDRIDLIFRSLSDNHLTNQPEGFSKKLIFSGGCSKSWTSGMSINYDMNDKLHDLEAVICMLTNRPIPPRSLSEGKQSLQVGNRYSFLGDSYQLQVYKSGTVHVFIHPALAIELNTWLAKKYPSTIPPKHRVKTKTIKEYAYHFDMLGTEDTKFLQTILDGYSFFGHDKNAIKRFVKFTGLTEEELKEKSHNRCQNLKRSARMLMRNGYPNIKDHQFYPTPDSIVQDVKEYLGNRVDTAKVLEPSAGTGKLASIFRTFNVTAVEVSGFFCEGLNDMGLSKVHNIDFLKFKTDEKFDLIAMNPPYSEGRLESHVEKALTHLAEDGEIVLIAPTGKLNKIQELAKGHNVEIVKSHENEFEDTSIATSIFSIT